MGAGGALRSEGRAPRRRPPSVLRTVTLKVPAASWRVAFLLWRETSSLASVVPASRSHSETGYINALRSESCKDNAAAAKSLQSCPTLQPHRQQPTRLLHPWDFPGKSTGVGCHCLLQMARIIAQISQSRAGWCRAPVFLSGPSPRASSPASTAFPSALWEAPRSLVPAPGLVPLRLCWPALLFQPYVF